MISPIQAYYLSKEEPTKSYLLALREYLLGLDPAITETWTHKMPMFRYKGKLFCYLWINKKNYYPYLGMYDGISLSHPALILGKRNKMKTVEFDPEADMPLELLSEIFEEALTYRREKGE